MEKLLMKYTLKIKYIFDKQQPFFLDNIVAAKILLTCVNGTEMSIPLNNVEFQTLMPTDELPPDELTDNEAEGLIADTFGQPTNDPA